METERFVIRRTMHMGPLKRELHEGTIVEWMPDTETLKVDGVVVSGQHGVDHLTAVRMLKKMRDSSIDALKGSVDDLKAPQMEEQRKPKTEAWTTLAALGCFAAAREHLERRGVEPVWAWVNDEQKAFLCTFADCADAKRFEDKKWLSSFACGHREMQTFNAWSRATNFGFQHETMANNDDIVAGAVIEFSPRWQFVGKESIIGWEGDPEGHAYPAVSMKDGVVVAKDARFHPYPVVRIHTADGLVAAMTRVDFMPDCPNSVFLKTVDLDKVRQITSVHEGVYFPMFEIDQTSDLTWMFGLVAAKNIKVANAKTRIKLKVNAQGQSRQLVSVGGINPVQMNGPFLFWIRMDGAALPVVAAVICPDAWGKPDKER